jgi:hypothetical protein
VRHALAQVSICRASAFESPANFDASCLPTSTPSWPAYLPQVDRVADRNSPASGPPDAFSAPPERSLARRCLPRLLAVASTIPLCAGMARYVALAAGVVRSCSRTGLGGASCRVLPVL